MKTELSRECDQAFLKLPPHSALNIAFNMMKSMDKLFGEEDAAEEDLFSDGYPDAKQEYYFEQVKENG